MPLLFDRMQQKHVRKESPLRKLPWVALRILLFRDGPKTAIKTAAEG